MSTRARETLEVVLDDAALGPMAVIGSLRCERRGSTEVVSFEYDRDYLGARHAVAIDPQLPLLPGPSHPVRGQRLFGVFRDAAPDRWGRMLMERREALEAGEAGRRIRHLSEWDFLTGVSDFTRMGALRLRDPGVCATQRNHELLLTAASLARRRPHVCARCRRLHMP